MSTLRDAKGHFLKGGKSLCPGGRPPGIRAKARAACEKYGIDPFEYYASVITNKKETTKNKLSACKELTDRMYGKATQYIESESKVSVNDLSSNVKELLNSIDTKDTNE